MSKPEDTAIKGSATATGETTQHSALSTQHLPAGLQVNSEIGHLRRVVVHSPGKEVALMTPALRHDLLFDDILYLNLAQHEHNAFKNLLSVIVPPEDVLDSADLLRDVLQDEANRRLLIESACRLQYLQGFCSEAEMQALCKELYDVEPAPLAAWLIEGMPDPGRHTQLTSFLSEMPYKLPPLPNLLFMRDPCAVIGNGLVVGHMTYPARRRESLLMRYVYSLHP